MSISVFIAQGQMITPPKPICCWCKVKTATNQHTASKRLFCTNCAANVFGYPDWAQVTKPLEGA